MMTFERKIADVLGGVMKGRKSICYHILLILGMIGNITIASEEDINLDDIVDGVVSNNAYWGEGRHRSIGPYRNFLGTGYGRGGYGDPLYTNVNLNVCQSDTVDLSKCTPNDPDAGQYQWRFITNIGWRKFAPYGAARKDWWDYKRTIGWPFNGYTGLR
jgi:hypothetical protein